MVTAAVRANYRRTRGWDDRLVLTYVGKLSHWYLPDEMARFFAAARKSDPRFFFQILTQSEPELMKQALEKAGVEPADYDIRFAPPAELPLILAASDAGISLRCGETSKPAVSPTKLGECLAAGLPVVTNAGVGDCDQMLGEHRLGVVLRDFSDSDYLRAADELSELLTEDDIARRCREFAERELSLAEVGGPRYAAVYERLLGAPNLEAYVSASSKTSEIA
jgi:glycosyltransferase involved in cell wall biosynthesis